MDGFFWKVGATPSICILASCCCCCCVLLLFDAVDDVLLGVAEAKGAPEEPLAAEEPDNQDDIVQWALMQEFSSSSVA